MCLYPPGANGLNEHVKNNTVYKTSWNKHNRGTRKLHSCTQHTHNTQADNIYIYIYISNISYS